MRDRIRTYRGINDRAAATCGEPTAVLRRLAGAVPVFSFITAIILSLFSIVILFSRPAWSATPAGTVIQNIATATFATGGGAAVAVPSAPVSVTTTVQRTPSVLEFLLYAPGAPGAQLVSVGTTSYSTTATPAGPFSALPPPAHITAGSGSAAIDISNPVPLVPATQYHLGEPVFVRLSDADQNWDPTTIETVVVTLHDAVTGDTEVLRLTETGPNTGVFTGYVQTGPGPAATGNGIMEVASGSDVTANYTDRVDNTDTGAVAALIDPFGKVLNSVTGIGVDGVTLTLVDAASGLPATVYGDDGVSIFPAAITSGGTAADSSGRIYTFSAGSYRFPFITPGRYRIVAAPPSNYRSPSAVPTAVLQALPGAPFAIVDPGSRGEEFIVNPGPSVHIDIPIDPVGNGLWLIKTAGKSSAAIGDLVPYRLSVQNTAAATLAPTVSVLDRLPAGFRYRKGSGRVNNAAADAVISGDGRTLTFSLGDLAPGATVDLVYVLEVGAGARLGTARNIAIASGAMGVQSNMAWATVEVTEDLFRSTATIAGRVFVDGCGDPDRSEAAGLAGVRIFLEDGTFVVSDKNGMFHFAAVQPGSHVVQLDTATVPSRYEILACEENTRFAGRPFSQFVDLQGGALWRADFHLGLLPRIQGEVGIELRSAVRPTPPAEPGEDLSKRQVPVDYAVPIHVGSVPVRNVRLTVLLPEGSSYVPGSSRLNSVMVADPDIAGTALTFRLGDEPADWEGTLRFDSQMSALGNPGQLAARASLVADTPGSGTVRAPVVENTLVRHAREDQRPVPDIVLRPKFPSLSAEMTRADRKQLKQIISDLRRSVIRKIVVIGHTDSHAIRWEARKKFADNYALSKARAEAVARELAKELNLRPDQITVIGKGPDEPVADNKTEKGRSQNRRVELKVENETVIVWSGVRSEAGQSGMKAVATIGNRPGDEWSGAQKGAQSPAREMPEFDQAWLSATVPGTAWVWPPERYYPAIAATKLAVKHDPGELPQIIQNGKLLDGLYSEGTLKRADGKVAVSIWKGVHLQDGDNVFELVLTDGEGKELVRTERIIHYSGEPVKAELVPERSRLVADGRKPPVLAVRLLDKDGYPAREGIAGDFTVDAPHVAQQRMTELQQAPLTAPATDRIRYELGPDGIALIELAPTTRTGDAVVRILLPTGAQEIRAWLKPENRDWVLVGLAEGTWGYNTIKGNMETAGSAGQEEDLYRDGRVAFYAKGMIKGEWLLTAAYDSTRPPDGRKSLYQVVDPNKYYLLYGDGAEQLHDAASEKHIYVKLERDQFYALFGDFSTGLTVTELSRYSRNMTGFKSEYKGDRYEYNLFVADTDQAHLRDELQGDGTSGLYHLSRRNIVMNTESVTVQTRDRFRSEVIVKQQLLSRNLDYTIDYESGTIFFKSPVPSRDENFNPDFIVVEYETFDTGHTAYTYGGRAAVKMANNRVQVGVTEVHEGTPGAEGNLTGVDASVAVTPTTKVRAEVASTRSDVAGAGTNGTAYLAEVQRRSETLDGTAYVREQEPGFGLGQQSGSETGTKKYGTTVNYRITQPLTVAGEAFRQENLGTGAVRDMAELRGRYGTQQYELFGGVRRAEDTFTTGDSTRSEQVFGGMKYQFTDRLSERLQHDQTLSGTTTNVDFPTRTMLGMDYKLTKDTTLFANEQLSRGSQADTAMTELGLKSSPWTGGQLSSSMEQQSTENGARLFATTGLKQSWQVTKQWSLDAGVDRSAMIRDSGYYQFNTNVPPVVGSTEDFTAVFFGTAYREEKWSWTGRVEQRRAASEDKSAVLFGANGEVRNGLALAAGLQAFRATTPAALEKFNGDLRLAVAYRPAVTRLILLDRFDYVRAEQHGVDLPFDNWRLINNLVLNYKLENRMQLSFQYGAKYVAETIDQGDYRGYTDLTGIECRYDLTKTWDVGVRGSILHSREINQKSFGSSASAGFQAARNMWISVGYNFSGFRDRDFSQSEFTAEGPFVKLRMKFDQVSVRDAVKWFSGQ